MKHLYFKILVLCSLLSLMACNVSVLSEMPDEALMERLLQEKPDSLAMLLEEGINPLDLPDSVRADHAWWLTTTHEKQRRSLVNDTLIHFAVDYYKSINSPRLLNAYLLAAEQANWSGTSPERKDSILNEALQIAKQQKDTITILNICRRLTNWYYRYPNKEKLEKLIQTTKQYAGKWNIDTYANLARQFFGLGLTDSVSKYLLSGIDLARKQNDYREFDLTRTYIMNLDLSGKSHEALKLLQEIDRKYPQQRDLKINYLAIWIQLGEFDSAQVIFDYFQPMLEKYKGHEDVDAVDFFFKASQSIIHAKKGEPVNFNSMGNAVDGILEKSRNAIRIDRERQFLQNKLIRDNLKLDIERGELRQRILWMGIIVLFTISFLVYFFQRKLLKKERSVQQAKEQLRQRSFQLAENESVIQKNEELIKTLSSQLDENDEIKQDIDQLSKENEILKQANGTLQKDISHYSKSILQKDQELLVYEKLAVENARLRERERFLTIRLITQTEVLDRLSKKPRYIDENQWPEITQAVNQLFDGFTFRLHTDFPTLTDEDICYCCLVKLRLSTSVMAALAGISPSSVTKRKQRIKEKMNQQRPDDISKEQSLEICLWNY